ncbi:MAG: ABC transporter permease [Desulfobacteraceae bacterium]|nr:MAG: ABC transporter permease [Desulfobacteraceae bacterium]
MISLYFRNALRDMGKNSFVNAVSIITIALSVIITSSFILFFINTSDVLSLWKKGVRIMAYLYKDVPAEKIPELQNTIKGIYSVEDVRFISREEAFDILKQQMKRQSSLLENLRENPLPDAFEIKMIASSQTWEKIENLASRIQSIPQIEEVEYGQRWLARFSHIIGLFKLSGYLLGMLFSVASVFIVANTVRLVLYSRRDEIEIMRLVGASDRFIKIPFYIEGIILGALGGIIGLIVLFITFVSVTSNIDQGITSGAFQLRFFSSAVMAIILFSSIFVGWLGCFLSLKQITKAV